FHLTLRPLPISTLFPYTTLFRSDFCTPATYLSRSDHRRKLRVPFSPTDRHMYSFFPRTVREWNDLDAPCIDLDCLPHFTMALISDRKSTRLNSSHVSISYAVFCL